MFDIKPEKILITGILVFLSHLLFAQITVSSNPNLNAICPGTSTSYTFSEYSCYNAPTLTGAGSSTFTWSAATGVMTISWATDWTTTATIAFTVQSPLPSGCGADLQNRSFTAVPRTLVGVLPTITGPSPVDVGTPLPLCTYTATTAYRFRGTADPTPFLVTNYTNWNSADPTWVLVPSLPLPTGNTATFRAHISNSTIISATPVSSCTAAGQPTPLTGQKTVGRRLPSPCDNGAVGIIANLPVAPDNNQPYLLCGTTTPVAISANLTPTQSIGTTPTYTWTLPAGWSFVNGLPTNGSTIFAVPNGTSAGIVTVVANAYGLQSTPCSLTISLRTLVPGTQAVGVDRICSNNSATYTMTVAPPATVNTTWQIVPLAGSSLSNVSPTSGTGASATITAGMGEGSYRIVFTSGTANCGQESVTTEFVTGRPALRSLTLRPPIGPIVDWLSVTQGYVFGCPGTYQLKGEVLGDSDGCITWTSLNPAIPLSASDCGEAQFTLPNNFSSYSVKATISNECGTRDYIILIIRDYSSLCNIRELVRDEIELSTEIVLPDESYSIGETSDEPVLPTHIEVVVPKGPGALIFPNPTTERLYIAWHPTAESPVVLKNDRLQVRLLDMSGRLHKQVTGAQGTTLDIDVSDLSSGTYLIQLQSGESISTERISILRR
jgi:hypothetical protein